MDFITALQSSASYLSDSDAHLMELLSLVAQMSDRSARQEAALALAAQLGGEDLLIFIKDAELDVLLPAAGFCQTLPDGSAWQQFLSETLSAGMHTGLLAYPTREMQQQAVGVAGNESSVLVLLGGQPQLRALAAVGVLLPLVAAALREEQAALASTAQASLAQQAVSQANALAGALDTARRELQAALSEAHETQRRSTFLAEASKLLAGSLDYETTLASLAQLVVPGFADAILIDVVDHDGQLRRLGAAPAKLRVHEAPGRPALSIADLSYNSHTVVQTGTPEVFPAEADEGREVHTPGVEQLKLLQQLGICSTICVPLATRSQPIGALTLLMADSARLYSARDLRLAEELGRRVALAIENAQLYYEAQQAIAVRDHFLSVASHELKTPITTLSGYAQLLERRLDQGAQPGSRSARAVAAIRQQARRLHRLSLTLLDLSLIQSGQLKLGRRPVDLATLSWRLASELQQFSERHTIVVSASSEPLFIQGDAPRLEHVLYSLITNAIKFSVDGGQIEIKLEQRGRQVCMSVIDHGIGIPPEELPQLFRRFYRAGNVEEISGMGLGLYIVKEIVALHHGSVEVESTEGQGSTFRVLLPLHDVVRAVEHTSSAAG